MEEHQVGLVTQRGHACEDTGRHLRHLTVDNAGDKAGGASRLPQTPAASKPLYHKPGDSWHTARGSIRSTPGVMPADIAPLARTVSCPIVGKCFQGGTLSEVTQHHARMNSAVRALASRSRSNFTKTHRCQRLTAREADCRAEVDEALRAVSDVTWYTAARS